MQCSLFASLLIFVFLVWGKENGEWGLQGLVFISSSEKDMHTEIDAFKSYNESRFFRMTSLPSWHNFCFAFVAVKLFSVHVIKDTETCQTSFFLVCDLMLHLFTVSSILANS